MTRIQFRLTLFFLSILMAVVVATAFTQEWEVSEDHDWCDDSGNSKYCEVREVTLDAWEDVAAKTTNGSIRVEGWDRDEIYIAARISVSGTSSEKARAIAEEIRIRADEDGIHATGPRKGFMGMFKGRKWSVSYRIKVPHGSDLDVQSVNGSLKVVDIAGDIEFGTTNGSVKLQNVAGDIEGGTTNGSIRISLDSRLWHGKDIDLKSTNGSVHIDLPHDFSASVEARTTNGGIRIDHPIRLEEKSRRYLRGTIGEGEATTVRVKTTNGGVSLNRQDA